MIKPRYEPVIQLGHIVQAVVYAGTILTAVFGGYMALLSSINSQNAAFDKRLTLVETEQKDRRSDEIAWRGEMRSSMQSFNNNVTQLSQTFNSTVTQLSREIADLRVSLAKVEPKPDRK